MQQKIKDIDHEMLQKLNELEVLINAGGLMESAAKVKKLRRKVQDQSEGENTNENSCKKNISFNKNFKDQAEFECNICNNSRSEETIYENAVAIRCNSSSEEELLLNSSGENENEKTNEVDERMTNLIVDERRRVVDKGRHTSADLVQPSTAGIQFEEKKRQITPQERAQQMVQEAENAKAQIFATQGSVQLQLHQLRQFDQLLSSTALVDEGCIVVGAHIDSQTIQKIEKGEYIDFGKLLPKERFPIADEDERLEMVIRNGKTYRVPASTSVNINSFAKWEQAFRVFSNIYTKANPHIAAELIEYNHVIHTVALAYVWDNVYTYDREFRMHMSRNPQRSWGMILQQAWSLRLKDRISATGSHQIIGSSSEHSMNNSDRDKIGEPCRRFNQGRCNFGATCKYEHRCSYSYKFGHSLYLCRRAQADRDKSTHHRENGFKKN